MAGCCNIVAASHPSVTFGDSSPQGKPHSCRGEHCSPARIPRRRQTSRANTVRPYIPLPIGPVERGLDPSKAPCNNCNLSAWLVGGGVEGSRSDQCPTGALNRTSVPALLDGGARCAPPSGRLGSSGTFLLLFWSQKSRNKWVEALYKRGSPQGGDTRWETAAATISNSSR